MNLGEAAESDHEARAASFRQSAIDRIEARLRREAHQQADFELPYSKVELKRCQDLWFSAVKIDKNEQVLMGIFAPILSFLPLILNSCAIAVLLHKSFKRSPSHIVLLFIFAVDMTTAGVPLPFFIYFYTLEYFKAYLPFAPCYLRQLLTRVAPTISNTASIWLFTFLALQRYLIVCKPMGSSSNRLRTWAVSVAKLRTNRCVIIILVSSLVIHTVQIIDRYPVQLTCPGDWDRFDVAHYLYQLENGIEPDYNYYASYSSSNSSEGQQPSFKASFILTPTVTALVYIPDVETCWMGSRFNDLLPAKVSQMIYATYFVFRALFIHLLPCCLVTFATFSLTMEIRSANQRRKKLLSKSTVRATVRTGASVIALNSDHEPVTSPGSEGAELLQIEVVEKTQNKPLMMEETNYKDLSLKNAENAAHSSDDSSIQHVKNLTEKANADEARRPSQLAARMKKDSSFVSIMDSFRHPFRLNKARVSLGKFIHRGTNSQRGSIISNINSSISAHRESKEYSITTMLIAIMAVFLSVQLPQTFLFCWGILSGLGLIVTSEEVADGFHLTLKIVNILYLLTISIQSGLCFVLNRPFRQSFLYMIGCNRSARLSDDAGTPAPG